MPISGVLELEAPKVTYPYDARSFSTNRPTMLLAGTAKDAEVVLINDGEYQASIDPDGFWRVQLYLSYGDNSYRIRAKRTTVVYDLEYTSTQFPISLESRAKNVRLYKDGVTYYQALTSDFYQEGVDYSVTEANGIVQVDKLTGGAFDQPDPVSFRVKYSVDVLSPIVTFDVTLVTSKETSFSVPTPVNVRATNYKDRVEVTWTELRDPNTYGYLVYAASAPQGGKKASYDLLTALPITEPKSVDEVRSTISEIVSRTRRLAENVSQKIVDEAFLSLLNWQVAPSSNSCALTQYRSKPSLSFSNAHDWCFAVYKLRYDLYNGSRVRIVLERNPNEAGDATAGLVIGDLLGVSNFDPASYPSVLWDAVSGVVEVHTGTEDFATDPGTFTSTELTIDLVVREDNLVEVYVDGSLIFTSVNAVAQEKLETQPISIAGKSGVVVRSVYLAKGENVDTIEVTTSEESLEYVRQFSYTIYPADYQPLSEGPIYVVVTAVGFDTFEKEEVESLYSEEVKGELLPDLRKVENYPIREQEDIRSSYITRLLDIDPYIDPKPGSVISDILIGPPAAEIERAWVLLDFASRAQSFISLLEIDYAHGKQLSVEESEYKQRMKDAFDLTDDEVQELIDAAFERLAANSLTYRKPATRAVGEVTFYVYNKPEETLQAPPGTVVISSGEEAQSFETLAQAVIQAEYADAYYNPETKRYEVTVPIRALEPGSQGNVSPGEITQYTGAAFDGCINNDATQQGQDREDNRSLAERAMLAYISVDVGTIYGYKRSVLDEGRVRSAKVIGAGEEHMVRDWDPLVRRNIGGKVDIYVRGSRIVSMTSRIAAEYGETETTQVMVSSSADGTFTIVDPRVTESTPLLKVVELVDLDFNAVYDLTNLQITGYNSFALDMSIQRNMDIGADPSHTYRARVVITDYVRVKPTYAPVLGVSRVRVVNPEDGSARDVKFGDGGWYFAERSDPYLEGNSVKSKDEILVYYDQENDSPTTGWRQVTDERVTLVGTVQVPLENRGVDLSSVVVSYQGTTFTAGNGQVITTGQVFELGTDYELSESNGVTYIRRSASSNIPDGLEVSVDYRCPDQVVVDYTYDALVPYLQSKLTEGENRKSHITADVLVKSAVAVPTAIELVVHLKPGYRASTVRQKVYAAIQSYISRLDIGDPLYQSDVIGVVEMVEGVDYVEVPLIRMTRDIGAPVNRERITDYDLEVYEELPIPSYKLTKDGGPVVSYKVYAGALNRQMFVQFYEDNYPYAMQTELAKVNEGYGRAYLQDDGTLIVSPYRGLDLFQKAKLEISYVVGEDRSVRNILVAPIEYLTVGFLSVSVVEH